MSEERVKLKQSVTEANMRADLLAQEVDDHHRQLERATQERIMLVLLLAEVIISSSSNLSKTIAHFSYPIPKIFSYRLMEKKHRERLSALEQELLNERELACHRYSILCLKYEKEQSTWQECDHRAMETIKRLEQVLFQFPILSFPYQYSFLAHSFTRIGAKQNLIGSQILDREVLSFGDKELRAIEEIR